MSLKDIRFDAKDNLSSLLDLKELNINVAELREGFHVPKEWVLLERTLLLLLGVCTTLDPDLNPEPVLRPYLEKFLLGDKGDWSDTALEAGRDALFASFCLAQ